MAASSLQAPKTKTLVMIRAWRYSGKWINPIETKLLLILVLFREWKRSLRTQTYIIHVQDRSGQLHEQQRCALATTCNRKFSNFVARNNMLQSKEVRLCCWQQHAIEGRSRTTLLLATRCNRRKFENFTIVCTFKLDVDALRERTCNHKMQQNQSRLRFLRSSFAACSNWEKERIGSSSQSSTVRFFKWSQQQ
jgi:hypothetical protein